jgi:hypothetical protein
LDFFDFAITEDAFFFGWINKMMPFIRTGKPVFAAEYTDTGMDFPAACTWGKTNQIRFILKNRILTAFQITCP